MRNVKVKVNVLCAHDAGARAARASAQDGVIAASAHTCMRLHLHPTEYTCMGLHWNHCRPPIKGISACHPVVGWTLQRPETHLPQ